MPVDLLGSIAGNVLTLRCQHSALGRLIICQRIGLIQQRIRIFSEMESKCCWKNRAFLVSQPGMGAVCTSGRFFTAASVLVKPPGLTSTEAAVKNLPLVHTAPIPGCETKNARFFQQHLLSISEKNPDTLLNQAYALAYDEAAQRTMLAAQRKHIPRNAAEQIYRHIVSETMLKERAV